MDVASPEHPERGCMADRSDKEELGSLTCST